MKRALSCPVLRLRRGQQRFPRPIRRTQAGAAFEGGVLGRAFPDDLLQVWVALLMLLMLPGSTPTSRGWFADSV